MFIYTVFTVHAQGLAPLSLPPPEWLCNVKYKNHTTGNIQYMQGRFKTLFQTFIQLRINFNHQKNKNEKLSVKYVSGHLLRFPIK